MRDWNISKWCRRPSLDLAVLAFLTECGPDDAAKSEKFSLIDEEIYDAPIKTQISQNIVASGVPTKEELEAEILKRYRAAEQRTAFRYHSSPTTFTSMCMEARNRPAPGRVCGLRCSRKTMVTQEIRR